MVIEFRGWAIDNRPDVQDRGRLSKLSSACGFAAQFMQR